ncbi:shikimate kinase AroL [Cronobacter dublinensis]|uniref:shikimate kinase AroL n=1 Tax=Cronobacter dublinensis TaxID=413497 RepID=UPI001375859C|nr:shikimate kinase AroL [Cronobacter dublinensis]EKK7714695.1 shikimate kinase AroL [Cronobacter dublinensis]ELQ6217173.1 shikimate kinase AroL [Cronobacter dublinensis]NCH69947.1 shikimate kinase AroL [Cronobacter dublinensis]
MNQPIYLIGARGCGKTTTGEALARALGYGFADTDRWLFEQTQMTVAEVVEKEGWPGFRDRESEALQAVTLPATVVATGGGMVLRDGNREFMRQHGVVIYLNVPVAVLAQRLEAFPEEGQRPTLTGKPVTEEIAEVLATRDALYRACAHHVIDAADTPASVVSRIIAALQPAHAS